MVHGKCVLNDFLDSRFKIHSLGLDYAGSQTFILTQYSYKLAISKRMLSVRELVDRKLRLGKVRLGQVTLG